jgi:predicted component of type VI protein secretion system
MYFIALQANSKSSQIQQNPAKPGQRKSKKKAWICLDFLVRIEPFQSVALTPGPKKSFPAPFPAVGFSGADALHPVPE